MNLKSNMDRFIEFPRHLLQREPVYLKSNMDRFIANYPVNAQKFYKI